MPSGSTRWARSFRSRTYHVKHGAVAVFNPNTTEAPMVAPLLRVLTVRARVRDLDAVFHVKHAVYGLRTTCDPGSPAEGVCARRLASTPFVKGAREPAGWN
jgi:hypothetical protein